MNEAETRAEHIDPGLKAAGWGVVEGGAFPVASGLGEEGRGFGLAVLGEADEGDGDFGQGFALAAADGVDDAGVVPVRAELPDERRQRLGLDAGGAAHRRPLGIMPSRSRASRPRRRCAPRRASPAA